MSGDLAGQRVLITGAARGIGAATAKRLHARGAKVVLAGIEPERLARTAAECGDALAVVCDVRDREQVEGAVEAASERLGGLDVVVANAGVAAQLPLVGGDPEVFERTIEVNLLGVYYSCAPPGPTSPTRAATRSRSPRSRRRFTRRCSAPTARPRPASRRSPTRCESSSRRVGPASESRISPSSTPTWFARDSAPPPLSACGKAGGARCGSRRSRRV